MTTFIGALALVVMVAAVSGMIWEFLQINKDNAASQLKTDQLLSKGGELLAKFDQLTTALTAVTTAAAAPPPKKKPPVKKRKKTATTETTDELKKGGSDGNAKTPPADS